MSTVGLINSCAEASCLRDCRFLTGRAALRAEAHGVSALVLRLDREEGELPQAFRVVRGALLAALRLDLTQIDVLRACAARQQGCAENRAYSHGRLFLDFYYGIGRGAHVWPLQVAVTFVQAHEANLSLGKATR